MATRMNVTGLHFIFLALLGLCFILAGNAQKHAPGSKYCPYVYDCPEECDEILDERGCPRCICGVPFYRAPKPRCLKNRRGCPLLCDQILDEDGCEKCSCGGLPFFRWPRPKPPQRPRTNFIEHKIAKTQNEPMNETDFVLDVRSSF